MEYSKEIKNIQQSLYETTFVFYTIRLRRTHTHTRNFIVSSYVPSSITSQLSKRFQESLSNSILPKTSLNLDPSLRILLFQLPTIKGEQGEEREISKRKKITTRSWTRINLFLPRSITKIAFRYNIK